MVRAHNQACLFLIILADIPVQIKASKEVIMSAGVIATPQILMLSGIGPRQDLRKLNIKPIVNLPDVGQHFADHPAVASYYLVNSNGTFDSLLRDTNLFGLELVKWNTTRQGRFVNSPANTYSFLRLPDDAAIYENFDDPSSGPTAGHMEIIFVVWRWSVDAYGSLLKSRVYRMALRPLDR